MLNKAWLTTERSNFFRNFTDEVDKENNYYDSQFEEGRPSRVWDYIESLVRRRDAELLEKVEGLKKKNGHEYCVNSQDGCDDCFDGYYNRAIDDVIKLIKGE